MKDWKKDFKFTVGIFIYTVVLFLIQVFLFSDLEKAQTSKEHIYSYQMDRWQYSSSHRWDELLNHLDESGKVLCDMSTDITEDDIKHLKAYYRDMFSIMMLSKSKFMVSSYMFDDIEHMISTIDSNVLYRYIASHSISDKQIEEFSELSKQYRIAIEQSVELEEKVKNTKKKLDAINTGVSMQETYSQVCHRKTPFFNESSMNIVNELNRTTAKMLNNYSFIADVYSNLSNFVLALKKVLMFLVFLRLQWLIMIKAFGAIEVTPKKET
ncbi:hypothetical protein LC147_26305 [Vibrio harveyi]|uniref:hypothetical protein n=1 Tax=Vibrio harveyi TaxID=669 RepID=UPI003BB6435F